MEGITQIDKTPEDIERCVGLVKSVIKNEYSEETWELIAKEIMDTALFIGGDFQNENITFLAQEYLDTGALETFLKRIQ